jgi:hypothetical protein
MHVRVVFRARRARTRTRARSLLPGAHQFLDAMIFWRPGNLNLARRSDSAACGQRTGSARQRAPGGNRGMGIGPGKVLARAKLDFAP